MKKYHFVITSFLLLFLLTGCGKQTIIGRWKAANSKDDYYYIFNDDKTCSYEMTVARLDCTFEENDDKLIVLYNGNSQPKTYKYHFDGNTLIITDDAGNENKYIQEK